MSERHSESSMWVAETKIFTHLSSQLIKGRKKALTSRRCTFNTGHGQLLQPLLPTFSAVNGVDSLDQLWSERIHNWENSSSVHFLSCEQVGDVPGVKCWFVKRVCRIIRIKCFKLTIKANKVAQRNGGGKIGPRIEPWGTPYLINDCEETWLFMGRQNFLLSNYIVNKSSKMFESMRNWAVVIICGADLLTLSYTKTWACFGSGKDREHRVLCDWCTVGICTGPTSVCVYLGDPPVPVWGQGFTGSTKAIIQQAAMWGGYTQLG